MKIGSYNDLPSKISVTNEVMGLYVSTLIADEVGIRSVLSTDLMFYVLFDKLKDESVIKKLLGMFKEPVDFIAFLHQMQDGLPKMQQLIKQKNKNKNTLHLIGLYRTAMILLRKELKEQLIFRLKEINVFELVPFDNEELWNLDFSMVPFNIEIEDRYIQELTQTITDRDYTLFFDEVVENLFSFCLFDSQDKKDMDFIKLPFWQFPLFHGITYLQMKYTRDDLKDVLEPFKTSFKELYDTLYKIPFAPENFDEIKQLSQQLIMPHKEPVQQSIDNSLYLSQLRNKTEACKVLKFCLGITSVENLVEYYVRCEIIKPYVATQVKQRIGREMDLGASCIFTYCTF